VDPDWLLPRLRLDPACGEIDIHEGGPIIVIDNEIHEDLEIYTLLGADEMDLCAYDNGGNTGASYSLAGGWLIDFAAEDRHTLTWIATGPHDLRQLALDKLSEAMGEWMPDPDQRCDATKSVPASSQCRGRGEHPGPRRGGLPCHSERDRRTRERTRWPGVTSVQQQGALPAPATRKQDVAYPSWTPLPRVGRSTRLNKWAEAGVRHVAIHRRFRRAP